MGIYNCLVNVWSQVCLEENARAPLETERLLRLMIELRDERSLLIPPDHQTHGMVSVMSHSVLCLQDKQPTSLLSHY